jgi:hypothetical protein
MWPGSLLLARWRARPAKAAAACAKELHHKIAFSTFTQGI